ncbi:MAG: hypothetical protein OXG97_01675 [Candidatus Poribacteria bacterium]|nr:hypothetical protein [Candidatus Poribacteria bacterium]
MRSHLHQQVNRKVSHFLLGEEGKVGSQSAFTAAAFIGATSLAGILLGTPNAEANNCGGVANCPADGWCCYCWATGYCDRVGQYNCKDMPLNKPGTSCWQV